MRTWKAWLIIAVMGSLAGFLVWCGLTIVVRAERVSATRVDVTLERRFLGFLPVSTESVPDVINAGVRTVRSRERRGATAILELTTRQSGVVSRSQFGPAMGTTPYDVADQVGPMLNDQTKTSLTVSWTPWLVNVAAIPFVLVVGGILGEVVLRALGMMKDAA